MGRESGGKRKTFGICAWGRITIRIREGKRREAAGKEDGRRSKSMGKVMGLMIRKHKEARTREKCHDCNHNDYNKSSDHRRASSLPGRASLQL